MIIQCDSGACDELLGLARDIATRFEFQCVSTPEPTGFFLVLAEGGLKLMDADSPRQKPLFIDFTSGKTEHRRLYGGGKSQAIAKAIGVKAESPTVIDATAGLGGDGFVLAALGCEVHLIERSSVIYALLEDAHNRAKLNPNTSEIAKRMHLHYGDANLLLKQLKAEVVLLDPMFPERKKTALVKKEMRILQALLGENDDADQLLELALSAASKRVVVKRPKLAPFLNQQQPGYSLKGKSNRFDIYIPKEG